MFVGIWDKARANKENIFYTILTVFLLERVRRGWNRIETRGKASNHSVAEIERRQQTFTFGAALLYALPFLLPTVKYIYRSVGELSQYVPGLSALNNVWAFLVVLLLAQALLSIIIYNLLGIYIERMNGALGFFRNIGRSVVDGSKVAVHAVGVQAPSRLYGGVRNGVTGAASSAIDRARLLTGRLSPQRYLPPTAVRRARLLAGRLSPKRYLPSSAIRRTRVMAVRLSRHRYDPPRRAA